jgi:hypothetical protein
VTDRLEQLEEARAASTVGDWTWEVLAEEGVWAVDPLGDFGTFVTTLEDLRPDDAAAIVAEHNAIPALIAAIRAGLTLADELDREAHEFAAALHFLPPDAHLGRKYLTGRVTSLNESAARIRRALDGVA